MTTTPLEINSSLSTILDRKLIHNKKIILNITLLLMSIPIIKETNKEIKISKSIRGVERKDLNIKNKIKFIHNNIEPTIRITKYKMKKISTMMEIKNYSYNQRRTNYKLNKMKIFDKLVLVMDVIIFILVIIY
jgi:energy-coupling factor transporter transmembrane protein EcfT